MNMRELYAVSIMNCTSLSPCEWLTVTYKVSIHPETRVGHLRHLVRRSRSVACNTERAVVMRRSTYCLDDVGWVLRKAQRRVIGCGALVSRMQGWAKPKVGEPVLNGRDLRDTTWRSGQAAQLWVALQQSGTAVEPLRC